MKKVSGHSGQKKYAKRTIHYRKSAVKPKPSNEQAGGYADSYCSRVWGIYHFV